MKKGKVSIQFAIMKDGRVSGMAVAEGGSSGDVALDRAAWGGITASNPFPPLPDEFGGQYLLLRFRFLLQPGSEIRFAVTCIGTSPALLPSRLQDFCSRIEPSPV